MAFESSFLESIGDNVHRDATDNALIIDPQIGGNISRSARNGLGDLVGRFTDNIRETAGKVVGKFKKNKFIRLEPGHIVEGSMEVEDPLADTSGEFSAYLIRSHLPQNEKGEPKQGIAVRRPILGTVIKSNTYASLSLSSTLKDGLPVPDKLLYDSLKGSDPKIKSSFNFLLQDVNQRYMELAQVTQTFGKTFVFFFDQRPIALTANGVLLNTRDFNWRNDFIMNYQEFLRGSKASAEQRKVIFAYDDLVLTGYILSMGLQDTAETREVANFVFEMMVTKVSVVPSYDYTKPTKHMEENEFAGKYGVTNRDGSMVEAEGAIAVYTNVPDAFSNYLGFNVRGIDRIKTLTNIFKEGSSKDKTTAILVTLSSAAKRKGAHIWELDRIIRKD